MLLVAMMIFRYAVDFMPSSGSRQICSSLLRLGTKNNVSPWIIEPVKRPIDKRRKRDVDAISSYTFDSCSRTYHLG
jgi:hypothetical protein